MYEAFFQLRSRPFPSPPRIDLYYPASIIENCRQTLSRCIERAEGPGLLVGGPGTGKSLVCTLLAEQFREKLHLVKLDHARFGTRRALLQAIMFELNLPYRALDEGELRLALIEFAKSSESGRAGLLLLVDEAQTLPARLIEEIRMFTNVVVAGQPRIRLVLSGNSSLEERLASPKLESLSQRIAARCYLQPLNYDETASYIRAHLVAAGGHPERIVTDGIWQAVYHASGGIPRLINQVCDHALMLAAVAQRPTIDAERIEEAWADLQQLPLPWPAKTSPVGAAESVLEFGSLEPCNNDEGLDAPATGVEAATREVIDLTSQLDEIELHVAEWDTQEPRPSGIPSASESPLPQLPAAPVQEPIPMRAANPFGDGFEEEQPVWDHYASLEAQSRIQGRQPVSHQEHEFAAALESIFQPAAKAGLADPAPEAAVGASAAAAPAAVDPAEPNVDALTDDTLDDPLLAAPAGREATCEPTIPRDEPAALRVAALRDLPPDDSDLIIVMDAEAHVGSVSRGAGKAHRQEYRHLFTKLRES